MKDVRDGTHDSPKYKENGYPLVTSKNLTDHGLDLTDISFISKEDFNVINQRSKVDVGDIIFGMIGTIGKPIIIDRDDFAIKNVALLKNGGTVENRFLIQLLKSPVFDGYLRKENAGGTQKFLSLSKIRDFQFLTPVIDEQQKIGTFFNQLDDTITLHQRKIEALKQMKKGFLQQLFPEQGESIPKLRFADFKEEWEQRKLGKLYQRNTERNKGQFGSEKTISIATMRFKPEGNGAAENSLNGYKVLRIGDIAYEGHTSKVFSFGRFVLNDIGDGIMSPRFTTLRPIISMNIFFWKQYIIYEPIMKHVLVKSTKLGTMMNELVLDDFFKCKIFVPSDNEQEWIGEFFKQLDDTITLHQRKLDQLNKLKTAFLQKMFI